jgi:hypothetical protein
MVALKAEHLVFSKETERLLSLLVSTTHLLPMYRKIVAEIVLLRLVILIENQVERIFAKLCCNAPYLDGSNPMLKVSFRSMNSARHAMKVLERKRPRQPIWNDGAEIRANVEHIVHVSDHCISVIRAYAPHFAEMRYVRHHIAHRSEGSGRNFRSVVRKYYGAALPGVTCGTLLLSPRVSTPPLSEVYIRTSRVLMKDLVKA